MIILAEDIICGWSLGALGPLCPGAALDDVPARLAPPALLAASALWKHDTYVINIIRHILFSTSICRNRSRPKVEWGKYAMIKYKIKYKVRFLGNSTAGQRPTHNTTN